MAIQWFLVEKNPGIVVLRRRLRIRSLKLSTDRHVSPVSSSDDIFINVENGDEGEIKRLLMELGRVDKVEALKGRMSSR